MERNCLFSEQADLEGDMGGGRMERGGGGRIEGPGQGGGGRRW